MTSGTALAPRNNHSADSFRLQQSRHRAKLIDPALHAPAMDQAVRDEQRLSHAGKSTASRRHPDRHPSAANPLKRGRGRVYLLRAPSKNDQPRDLASSRRRRKNCCRRRRGWSKVRMRRRHAVPLRLFDQQPVRFRQYDATTRARPPMAMADFPTPDELPPALVRRHRTRPEGGSGRPLLTATAWPGDRYATT